MEFKPPENQPYAFIQWKASDIFIDAHCECGYDGNMDGEFVYQVQCPECNRVYALEPYIKLVEVTDKKDIADPKMLYEMD